MAGARFLRWRPGGFVAAFAMGVLVHLAMDYIPHTDYNDLGGRLLVAIVFLESLVASILMFFIVRDRISRDWIPSIVAGLIGSSLPDAKFFAPLVLPTEYAHTVSEWGERLHYAIHAPPTSFGFGMATQLTAVVVLLAALASFPRTRKG